MARLKILSEIRGVLSGLALVALVLLVVISVNLGLPGQELVNSLRFHIGILVLLLALTMILAGARLRGALVLVLVGISLGQGAFIVIEQQARRDTLEASAPVASFKLLSFNVLGSNPTGADAAQYIIDSGADVVVVMEARGIGAQLPELDARYPYRIGCEPGGDCDLAILSRWPFLSSKQEMLRALSRQRLTQVSVMVGEDHPVTVVAAHLTKPYFDDTVLYDIEQVRHALGQVEGPLVLAGDFNAAAWSSQISEFATAANLIPPPRYPGTWPVELGPLGVPIDNMFSRGTALIRTIDPTPQAFGSNHLGLMATVDLY
ncbi:endonuclease/exonuclease/phosphatase family protein [Devosia sp. YR412]|uniref:endonuclease/exonuclease/phosphatase family protein n=1 Tax=Devosia sp. YR412 TaxID=1881030 RepID=UPI00147C57E3|nr:endonuclease/exonuclease/phosphatase family protein [Devosia sp. YR412]